MRRAMQAAGGTMCLLLIWGIQAGAQPNAKKAEPGPVPTVKPEKAKDPTDPSPKLREFLETPKLTPGAAALPGLVLRGRIVGENGTPAVLLELDPKQPPVLIHAGTVFGIGGLKMKVLEVTETEVRIEVSSRSEIIVLR